MFFTLKSYLHFLLKSTNQHGVHSPFVYDMVTKCFYKKTNKNSIAKFLNFKRELLQDHSILKVTDFGAGSKVFKNEQREVSKIAKHVGISYKRAKLLIRLMQYFNPNMILEIGTSLGIGTSAMKIGNSSSKITTLEGCPEIAKKAKQQFDKLSFTSINLVVGDFKETLADAISNQQYDFIYFDGNHQKAPTLDYFEACLKTIHNDSFFIFDDIHWNKEMEDTWEIIKKHPKVKITVDTFQWGIVFFRKEQVKEHFTIRV
jgi:predicted O-methyltransferase YrrM